MVILSLLARRSDGRYWPAKTIIQGEGQLRHAFMVGDKYQIYFEQFDETAYTNDYLQTSTSPFHVGDRVDFTNGEYDIVQGKMPTDGSKTNGKITRIMYASKWPSGIIFIYKVHWSPFSLKSEENYGTVEEGNLNLMDAIARPRKFLIHSLCDAQDYGVISRSCKVVKYNYWDSYENDWRVTIRFPTGDRLTWEDMIWEAGIPAPLGTINNPNAVEFTTGPEGEQYAITLADKASGGTPFLVNTGPGYYGDGTKDIDFQDTKTNPRAGGAYDSNGEWRPFKPGMMVTAPLNAPDIFNPEINPGTEMVPPENPYGIGKPLNDLGTGENPAEWDPLDTNFTPSTPRGTLDPHGTTPPQLKRPETQHQIGSNDLLTLRILPQILSKSVVNQQGYSQKKLT